MGAAAIALWLSLQGPPPPPTPQWFGGRVITSPSLHLGVRPALDVDKAGDFAVGLTVQVTGNAL